MKSALESKLYIADTYTYCVLHLTLTVTLSLLVLMELLENAEPVSVLVSDLMFVCLVSGGGHLTNSSDTMAEWRVGVRTCGCG